MSCSTDPDIGQEDLSYNFDPGEEYELNHFLAELADEITTEELKKLKFYIGGRGGSGKATLENIKDALDYFEHLRQKDLLSSDNICGLQAFIWHIGRKDLYKKMVEFGRQFEQTLYLHAPKETPENGYKHVKFHVQGKVGRGKIERMKSEIARLLRVPQDFVFVAGVEKSNILIITLMIPEECEMVLATLTDKEKAVLVQESIDYFTMDGKLYLTKDTTYKEEDDEEIRAVHKLMEKGDKIQKELDRCHADLTVSKTKIKELTSSNEQIANDAIRKFLDTQISKDIVPDSLQRQASMKHLAVLMDKANRLDYDCQLIEEMLNTNCILARTNVTDEYRMLINQLQWNLELANTRVLQFQYINERLSFELGRKLEVDEGSWDSNEFLKYVALQKAQLVKVGIETSIAIDDETLKRILYDLARELTKRELASLCKAVKMNKKEEQRYKRDPNTLLEIIMLKTRKPEGGFDPNDFIRRCLLHVKRPDLLTKPDKILKRIIQEKQSMNKPSQSPRGNVETDTVSTASENPTRKQAGMDKSDTGTEQSLDMNSRLKNIEEMMEKLLQVSAGKYQSKMPYFDDVEDKKLAAKLFFSQRYMSGLE